MISIRNAPTVPQNKYVINLTLIYNILQYFKSDPSALLENPAKIPEKSNQIICYILCSLSHRCALLLDIQKNPFQCACFKVLNVTVAGGFPERPPASRHPCRPEPTSKGPGCCPRQSRSTPGARSAPGRRCPRQRVAW